MSTETLDPIAKDHWVTTRATWDDYLGLLESRGDHSRPKLTFLEGKLTLVSPGHAHDSLASRLVGLIQEILVELSIDCHVSGEVTLRKSVESREGTEADASYYLNHIDEVKGVRDLIMGIHPPPDLVVEVVVSHPVTEALEAYRRFKVREVWVCEESRLAFLILGEDGRYTIAPKSDCFPFLDSAELTPWVFRDHQGRDTRVLRQFRAWVLETLVPRKGLTDDTL